MDLWIPVLLLMLLSFWAGLQAGYVIAPFKSKKYDAQHLSPKRSEPSESNDGMFWASMFQQT